MRFLPLAAAAPSYPRPRCCHRARDDGHWRPRLGTGRLALPRNPAAEIWEWSPWKMHSTPADSTSSRGGH